MPNRIVKQTGGFYYIDTEEGIIETRARGKFRNDNISPVVGDFVNIKDKFVSEILPRKNLLHRPLVSNVDLLIMVVSTIDPKPNYFVIDKITAIADFQNIPVCFILTKTDIKTDSEFENIYKNAGYLVLDKRKDFEKIKGLFKDKFCVLCGNSGVGKSTLINELSGLNLETDKTSKALGRGKHTTRVTELYKVLDGLICDTPGFSDIESDIPKEQLQLCFPEFKDLILKCKFTGCSHTGETGCAIVGNVPLSRLESYKELYNEAKVRNKWDDVRSMPGKR